MKTSLFHNNYENYIKLFFKRFFNIFRIFCQILHDHSKVDKKTEVMINKCLNQTKYKKYISEIKQVSFKCKESSPYCITQFMIHPKSDQILEYEEMLIVDDIALLGNLGGLLGLFVGFSVFGYASVLVDVILEKIKPGVLSLIPGLGLDGLTSPGVPSNGSWNNGLNGSANGNASNPIHLVGMAHGGTHPGSRGLSGDSWSITIPS